MPTDKFAYFWNTVTVHKTFYTFQWHITDRCNLNCTHCYQEHLAEDPDQQKLHLVLKQIRLFLLFQEKIQKRPISGRIVLTGGEPFIRDDFIPLIEKIKAIISPEISFAVLTNGTRMDASTAGKLARLRPDFVQVSLEGPQSLNDNIRGKGSYQQAVSGLEKLVKEEIRTLISFTAHKTNHMHFQKVVKEGCRIGVNKIWADRLVPMGQGKQLESLDLFQTRFFFEQMLKSRRWARQNSSKTKVSLQRALQFLARGGKPYQCRAGDSLLTIMSDGNVLPCRRMPVIIGNLYQRSLVDIYHSSRFLKKLKDRCIVPKGCEGCRYAESCRGGARCLSFAKYRDPFMADPGCRLAAR